MFAKTIISLAFLFIMLFGLFLAIRDHQYIMFAIGISGYFLVSISSELCKCYKKN